MCNGIRDGNFSNGVKNGDNPKADLKDYQQGHRCQAPPEDFSCPCPSSFPIKNEDQDSYSKSEEAMNDLN